jgi:hypothetical protein
MSDRKIIKYDIVIQANYGEKWGLPFGVRVQEMLDDGWVPYGDPFTIPAKEFGLCGLAQAVVKYDGE